MKKKFVLLTAVILIICNMFTTLSVFAASDIGGHWAQSTLEKWVADNKIRGYSDGTIRPDNNVTRAEFAKMLSSVIVKNPEITIQVDFSDVVPGDWFYGDVKRLLNLGIVKITDKFNPSEYITRQDAMTMIGRAFNLSSNNTSAIEAFIDSKLIAEYAVKYVSALASKGFVKGYEDKTIRPQSNISRAEGVILLDRFVKDEDSLESIMAKIYDGVTTQMPRVSNIEITPENSQYFLGIENMKFVEALASEAMIGSQAHSVCLVRVEEGADVAAIKEQIRTSVNPRKWICVGVERDEVIVENIGNLILLVIDQFAPKEISESFLALEKELTLLKPDKNNLIYTNGYYMNNLGTMQPASVINFASKVNYLVDTYLKESKNIFYSIIPSKNYYVNDKLKTPFNYGEMNKILSENIKGVANINLYDTLTLEDYYKTDFHWRQEKLDKVVNRLGEKLGFKVDFSKYQNNSVTGFIGQHGYGKENFPSEDLVYLTNNYIDSAHVVNFELPNFNKVYNIERLSTKSPYDVFLSGATPLLTIKNNNAKSEKQLIIFRDSFTSSLAPLLIEQYSEITLIDIRYAMSSILGDFVDFKGQDVLFLYNDEIVNNSYMLK